MSIFACPINLTRSHTSCALALLSSSCDCVYVCQQASNFLCVCACVGFSWHLRQRRHRLPKAGSKYLELFTTQPKQKESVKLLEETPWVQLMYHQKDLACFTHAFPILPVPLLPGPPSLSHYWYHFLQLYFRLEKKKSKLRDLHDSQIKFLCFSF
jgi:hypothetical protein